MRTSGLITVVLLLAAGLSAQEADAPLFQSHHVLELTLETDLRTLRRDRREDASEYIDAVMRVAKEDGNEEVVPLRVRTRGHFRLDPNSCWFPPVRLNFPSDSVAGTTFEGQDKLKLVTHCRRRGEYEQNVLEEYLAYRIYNLLSDISFRVRPARVTYVDREGGDDTETWWAFLIEDEGAMAARVAGEIVDLPQLRPAIMDSEFAVVQAVFQFMIGNTDWSQIHLHNLKILRTDARYVSVPYDFDFSGLVDADYARPDPALRSGTVRFRLYRGYCRPTVAYAGVYERFQAIRDDVYDLIRGQPGLSESSVRRAVEYLDDFYEILDDPAKAKDKILDECRDPPERGR